MYSFTNPLKVHPNFISHSYVVCRKIVLATNIAESSITIDDVVYVIDCGKAKETSYDALNKLACLLPSWISKASADQVANTNKSCLFSKNIPQHTLWQCCFTRMRLEWNGHPLGISFRFRLAKKRHNIFRMHSSFPN